MRDVTERRCSGRPIAIAGLGGCLVSGMAEIRNEPIQNFAGTTKDLLRAIRDNAPFYREPIRKAAKDTYRAVKTLFEGFMRRT